MMGVAASVEEPRARAKPFRRERNQHLLMLAPALVLLILLIIVPVIYLFFFGFHRQNTFQHEPPVWVGGGNFTYLFGQPNFIDSILRTFKLAGFALGVEMVLGFLLAAVVYRLSHLRGMGLIRTLFTTPILLAPIVAALMWRYMYQSDFGVINFVFEKIGLPTEAWLANADLAIWSVAVIDIWQWTPFVFLVVLAGMYGLPRSIYEAAELDGTNILRQLVFITVPLLWRLILIVVLLRLIDLMRFFDVIVGTTQGGPGTRTQTLPVFIWVSAFQQFSAGDSAAASIVLLGMATVIIVLLIRLMARRGLVGAARR
jgi:multiple sugar transport system permease protein